jgi:hypothetical protein
MFVVLLFLFFCVCWIPLVAMKEDQRFCSSCGIKLG